ncbi:MAG: nicotinate-nucleotide--dimethylbenzimidazole phosphoribosyltransferase [Myxococcales bacterium]|nr:nicotinate-nucleotide--dimethylbenzimidazole phosphoribosyltransferase [Myxococcales bacterium]
MTEVIDQIVESICPASVAQATGAAQALLRSGLASQHGGLAGVATRLCAARHAPRPKLDDKVAVVVAADHGVASPGIDLGDNSPTVSGLLLIAEGGAAINAAARSASTQLVLVDAGIRGGESIDLGQSVLSFRAGNGTENFCEGCAMSEDQAENALQTGIALAFSLADVGLDILALGQVAAGSQPTSAAIVAAITAQSPAALSPDDQDVVDKALRLHDLGDCSAIELLLRVGGFDIAVMTGMILAAASINVPVVLDGHGSSAAALVAHKMSPHIRGYLFVSHSGGIPAHVAALKALELEPLFAVGLAQGEGTGAVLALPMLDAAARVIAETGH